jgi:hypothetical protein
MTRLMGPILSFRGSEKGKWQLSAVVVTDGDPPEFAIDGTNPADISHDVLWSRPEGNVHRFLFSFDLGAGESTSSYKVDGEKFEVALPGKGNPRMAYASCNGFSHPKYMKHVDRKNRLWEQMDEKHGIKPYHLLLLGGDQVYADPIWEAVASIKQWNHLPDKAAYASPFTPEMATDVEKFYFDLYVDRWEQPEVRAMMTRVPSVAMWDDHDIFDGWGSYLPGRQNCPVFQGIGGIATKAFAVFQQHVTADEKRPGNIAPDYGYSFGYVVGKIGILAIDMRFERSLDAVLSPQHWSLIYSWIDGLKGLDHLILLSSIPVVYPGFDTLEGLLGFLPGRQDLEDDLRDHWNTNQHKDERLRLIHRLFSFAANTNIRPTIISGDVHVAAVGVIESTREPSKPEIVINQLISSGIVHPGPNAVVLFCLKHLFDSTDEVDRGIVARMTEFPGNKAKFIGQRNFLSLEPDDQRRIWANWILEAVPESETHPVTKVLHPIAAVEGATKAKPRAAKRG